jgi:type VI secretion system protein ImpA
MDLATPAVLDLEALLTPIPGENPSGCGLAYAPEYDEIREARRAEENVPQGEWQRKVKAAEWDRVVALGTDCLAHKTKDLQIAAWMTEALGRLHGFAGLRDGFRLLHGIQEQFWDTFYPEIDEGDLEARASPHLFLNHAQIIPLLVRQIPLTSGLDGQRYSYLHWEESRATENAGLKDPDRRAKLIAQGKLSGPQFDDAVAQTPRRFFERLAADLRDCAAAFQQFDQGTDHRFGRAAPSLGNIRKALDDVHRLIGPILQTKRTQEPDPELDGVPEAPTASTEGAAGAGEVMGPGGPRTSLGAAGLDAGRVLIAFHDLAQQLAEAGGRLIENRRKYAELQDQLRTLDEEYQAVSQLISRNEESYRLLSRLLELHGRALAPAASDAE